nr:hypothetical protein [Tanacetum cinerariifolium]
AFFKEAWDIVSYDVISAIQEFFVNGNLLKELNHTIIALIPKVSSPSRINGYRPISCCNVLFKCVSKVIANWIKESLKMLISPNQSAFVPGRKISDNILLTHELMHNYHLDRGAPRCTFKVGWIMECVSSTSFLIGNNGALHGYFRGKRDDLFLFSHGDASSARVIIKALEEFKLASGLIPSLPKSTAYFCNVLNHVKISILNILPFEEGRLPVKYLGVPLVSSRLVYRDCREFLEKVRNRVRDWKNMSLSAAGRLQLVQSIIGSMHVDMKRGKPKVSWDEVCRPKQKGGLGLKRLDLFNKALMISHIWSLISCKESIWVKWIHTYKLKGQSFWEVLVRGNITWGMRKILQIRPLIREFIWHRIGSGSTTSMWYDRWCSISPIANVFSARDIHHARFSLDSKVCDVKKLYAGLSNISASLESILAYIVPIAKRRKVQSVVAKLVLAASIYFIWQERNWRFFKKGKRTATQIEAFLLAQGRVRGSKKHTSSQDFALNIAQKKHRKGYSRIATLAIRVTSNQIQRLRVWTTEGSRSNEGYK